MAEVIHRYVRDPQLVAKREAAAKIREEAAKRKEAAKLATSRLAQRGVAELRLERTNHEKTKRLEMEMQIALRRGELIEKSVVLQQAGFLLTALRQRCLAAPSAWSRRILNISDPREMNERLREMMVSVLEEIADLPERVTDPNWVAEGDATPFAEDDRGNGDGKLRE